MSWSCISTNELDFIAREYGLPCVTGIPDAVSLIHTGDEITVDGYLGIVTILQKGL
jgi:pyruvate,water dikinase